MSSTYTASTQGGSVSPLTTKGDIYTYDTADARLPIGADGTTLIADSAQTTGNKWGVLQEAGGGTAQSSYDVGDMLFASASNTLSKLAIGSRAQFPIVTSSGVPTWKNPSTIIFQEWDFLNGSSPWATVISNGGSITNASSSGHNGVVQMNTGTNTNGIATFRSTNRADDITFSGGLMRAGFLVHLSALSDGTDTYYAAIGFNDSNNSAQIFSDAIAFRYSSALNSGQWVLYTSNGGVATSTNTATAVAGNTWYFLEIELNAAANNVEFFVNGVSLGSNTTNIPTTCGMYHSIEKTAGTTSRILTTDYAYFYQELSSARY